MEDGVCNLIEKVYEWLTDIPSFTDDEDDEALGGDGGKLAMVFHPLQKRRSPLVPPGSS